MKPEAQRIAIAEACGWSDIQEPIMFSALMPTPAGIAPNETDRLFSTIPDYLNSLDAMHEAEKVLSATQLKKYHDVLVAGVIGWGAYGNEHIAIHANAAQRAEAFLRTIGKWEDES